MEDPQAPPPASPAAAQSEGLAPNSAAAIAYLTVIPAIIFLVIDPYKKMPLVRFHAFQNIALVVGWIVLWIVVAVASMILALIPGLRMLIFLVPFLYFGLGIAVFILWLMAIIKASKGEWFKMPIIGDFAMKMAQSSN
jgi:uncharacterized membrane protein